MGCKWRHALRWWGSSVVKKTRCKRKFNFYSKVVYRWSHPIDSFFCNLNSVDWSCPLLLSLPIKQLTTKPHSTFSFLKKSVWKVYFRSFMSFRFISTPANHLLISNSFAYIPLIKLVSTQKLQANSTSKESPLCVLICHVIHSTFFKVKDNCYNNNHLTQ